MVPNFQFCAFSAPAINRIDLRKKTEKALEFAQTQLSERGEDSPECLEDMEPAFALLSFNNLEDAPFSDLLFSSQGHKVSMCCYWSILVCYS